MISNFKVKTRPRIFSGTNGDTLGVVQTESVLGWNTPNFDFLTSSNIVNVFRRHEHQSPVVRKTCIRFPDKYGRNCQESCSVTCSS